jgi:hypothetical protein
VEHGEAVRGREVDFRLANRIGGRRFQRVN